MRVSKDGNWRYSDNIFVERLWRTVKCEEVDLKAYANVLDPHLTPPGFCPIDRVHLNMGNTGLMGHTPAIAVPLAYIV